MIFNKRAILDYVKMGFLEKNWLSNKVLPIFNAQIPKNSMQKIVIVTDSRNDSDKTIEDLRFFLIQNIQLIFRKTSMQVTDANGLMHLKNNSQDLVVIHKMSSNRSVSFLNF